MLTFICKEEKGIVVEAMIIGDKHTIKDIFGDELKMYGTESSLTIVDNCDYLYIDISEEYTEDEDGEGYPYEQIYVTIPLNKIVKTYVHNTCKITPYFFRDFGDVFITDGFKHIRLTTT